MTNNLSFLNEKEIWFLNEEKSAAMTTVPLNRFINNGFEKIDKIPTKNDTHKLPKIKNCDIQEIYFSLHLITEVTKYNLNNSLTGKSEVEYYINPEFNSPLIIRYLDISPVLYLIASTVVKYE